MSYTGFFLNTPYQVVDGNIVYAADLNSPLAAISNGIANLVGSIQTGAIIASGVDIGAVNAYKVDLTAAPTAYVDGLTIWFKPAATNTGAATIDINDLGAIAIRSSVRSALVGGELLSGFWFQLKYSYSHNSFLLVSYHGGTDISATRTLVGGDGIEITSNDTTVWVALADGGITSDKFSLEAQRALVPVGTTIIWDASDTPPIGYLEKDGSAISRTTYSALFAVQGTKYGVGDGTTTFNLQDQRGEFLRGWAHGSTNDPNKATRTDRGDGTGGDVIGSKQADAFKAHGHPGWVAGSTGSYDQEMSAGSGALSYFSTDVNTSIAGGLETRPRNVNVMFCIKY